MKIIRTVLLYTLVLATGAVQANDFEPAFQARYRVTFEATWSEDTHPGNVPAGAHFSPLIGVTHQQAGALWQTGTLASDGIEQMAETGGRSVLSDEITRLIDNGQAEFPLLGGGTASPGTASFEFMISQSHPRVSLVTMIAPSPDWFVGVNGLSLRQDGQWLEQLTHELLAYDSGTDHGLRFTDANADANPPVPVSRLTEAPFAEPVPLGRFIFERLSSNSHFPVADYHSGLYYDPQRSGEGIHLILSQRNQQPVAALTWYTYHNGQQLWLAGSTNFEPGADTLNIELTRTEGTNFGAAFNSADIQRIPWGNVTLTFPTCDRLLLDYRSDDAFSSGQLQLVKLLGVADLACQ